MNGLELANAYYQGVGAAMIRERFGDCADRMAVGLVGPGSECFGFDDELSRDHDWGPAFCIWLTDEDFDEIGTELRRAYAELPTIFMGYGPRLASPGEEWRVGPSTISTFFLRFTGLARTPATTAEWLRIPEHNLATCTNGKVFYDPLGEFTHLRERLLAFYPEDIRLAKIASLCITVAQTGQYNYTRSVQRHEAFSMQYVVTTFCADAMKLLFLLNRRYAPFYKWLHRATNGLPILGSTLAERVAMLLDSISPNTKMTIMENISSLLAQELRNQGLSESTSGFLLDHAPLVQNHISDPVLRRHLSAAP